MLLCPFANRRSISQLTQVIHAIEMLSRTPHRLFFFSPSAEGSAASVAAFAYNAGSAVDPYNLHARFVLTQRECFSSALREVQQGQKRGHWSWFCLPVAPFVVNGVELGSLMNRKYALRDHPPNQLRGDACCAAYLRFPADAATGISLRGNYLELMSAAMDQLEASSRCGAGGGDEHLFGLLDAPKFRASIQLFESVSRPAGVNDAEINAVCRKLLELVGENPFP